MPKTSEAALAGRASGSQASRVFPLHVPAGMDSAVELRESLAKSLARGKSPVRVEVGTIGFPDVPVLQVLCAAHRRAIERGVDFVVAGDGATSVEYLAGLCGLSGPASCGIEGATCPWARRDVG